MLLVIEKQAIIITILLTVMLITTKLKDVAIPGDRNVIKEEAEKILKYKILTIEIQCMWNVKTKLIPVITGATETLSKSLRQYLSNTPGKHEIKEL
jgi:hypothetical protein